MGKIPLGKKGRGPVDTRSLYWYVQVQFLITILFLPRATPCSRFPFTSTYERMTQKGKRSPQVGGNDEDPERPDCSDCPSGPGTRGGGLRNAGKVGDYDVG